MTDAPRRARRPRRRLRRGVVVALIVLVVVVGAAAAVLVVRARQPERSAEALCAHLAEAQDLDQALTTPDPAVLDPQVRALRRARDVAPGDIEPSVRVLADYVGEVADEVDAATGDPRQALTDALAARQDEVDAVTAAGTAVTQWATDNCGLTLGPTGTTPAETGAPAPTEAGETS